MFSYLSVFTAGYKTKPRRVVWVRLTLSRVALQVESAAVVHCTLHGTLSHVWKAAAADTSQIHDVARFIHGTHPVSARNRQHRHERLRCTYSLFICCIYKKGKIFVTTQFTSPRTSTDRIHSWLREYSLTSALVDVGQNQNIRFVYCFGSLMITVRFCSCSEYFEMFSCSVRVL